MNKIKNNKPLLISLIVITSLVVLTLGLYNFNETFKSDLNHSFYLMSIDFEKMMNGYSIKEINETLNNNEICLSDKVLNTSNKKYSFTFNELTDNEAFEDVKHFEVYATITYKLKDEAVKEINVDEDNKQINVYLVKPEINIDIDYDGVNYLSKHIGLLSIRDLRLSDDDLNKVYNLLEEAISKDLEENNILDEAIKFQEKLYKQIYSSLLQDITGSPLFDLNIKVD